MSFSMLSILDLNMKDDVNRETEQGNIMTTKLWVLL